MKTLAATLPVLTLLSAPATAAGLTGDYVEARSASVYAGACHYNGELTTAGREAIIGMFNVKGEHAGQKLDGLNVFAVIAGDANLSDPAAPRRSVVYYSEGANAGQRDALVAAFRGKADGALGEVLAVKPVRAKVSITATAISLSGFSLEEPGRSAVSLDVTRYPCKHCMMPAQTWYEPFVRADGVQVAQGVSTGFTEEALGVSWRQETADNVFVGTFTL